MNELQKIELEMLKEFVRICEELDLSYYLVCGTALGAVKYGGFIPWDDDVDVALPRKDYDIFCQKAQKLLPAHLFLQNHITDPEYSMIFSKIRNSNTTYIESSHSCADINHGVYIDVFPLDGYPAELKDIQKIEKEKYRYNLLHLCCIKTERSLKATVLSKIERFLGVHKKSAKFTQRLIDNISKYSTDTSTLWCNHGNWQGTLEYAPKEQYGNGEYVLFEGLKVRVPEKYDDYLTQKYGDWQADLPKEQQVGHHYYDVCDLNRPYTHYMPKK